MGSIWLSTYQLTVIRAHSVRLMLISFLTPMDTAPDHWDRDKCSQIMTAESFLVTVSMGMGMNQRQKTLKSQPEGHRRPFHFQRVVAVYSFYVWGHEKISNINLFHWRTLANPTYENPALIQGAVTSILPPRSPGCE